MTLYHAGKIVQMYYLIAPNHTSVVTIGSLLYIRVQINPELYVRFVPEGIIIVLQVGQ